VDRYLQGAVLWPPGATRLRVYYVPPAEQLGPLADAYRAALAPFDFIGPIADRWLHATIGAVQDRWTSEVTRRELSVIEARLGTELAGLPAFMVCAGGALASRHGVVLDLTPDRDCAELIRRTRAVLAGVLGPAAARYDDGRPHIALAYGTGPGDSGLVQGRLRNATDLRVPLQVAEVALVEVSQDAVRHHVRWRELARIPLGRSPARPGPAAGTPDNRGQTTEERPMSDAGQPPTVETIEEYPVIPMPRAPGCPFDQPPGLRALQASRPLTKVRLWNGNVAWLATRHAYHQSLLGDRRLSADATIPGWPAATAGTAERARRAPTILTMSDSEHDRIRGMVAPSMTPEQVERTRPVIQGIVDGLIDDMLAGPRPADLVEAFAEPAASLAICSLLGVPFADHDFLQRQTKIIVTHGSARDAVGAANDAIIDFLDHLLDDKRARPADDVLSTLAVGPVADGRLTQREAAITCALLLLAGHETTGNMIALGSLLLLEHPDQLAELRETEDPELVTGAVEELLRYLNVPQMGRRRVALADIEVDGQPAMASSFPATWPTAIPRSSPTPTGWTSTATRAVTWPSAGGCTSAWARHWSGSPSRSPTARCTGGFRP
jgi:cytochrome P450